MGRMLTIFAAALTLTALAGCESNQKKDVGPAVSDQTAARTAAARIREHSPNAVIGRVTKVLATDNLVEVTDLSSTSAPVGEVMTFMNGELAPVAQGKVETYATTGNAFVRFEVAEAGRRPVAGDLAVIFSER